MISRYSEYIPVAIEGHVEQIYVILHDLGLTGEIIPMSPKIKNIFCLSEWHVDHFLQTFPQFKQITKPFHYGIDFTNFIVNESSKDQKKVKRSFIYSSFPNRGLLTILNMWPEIIQRYPDATLNIFCDLDNNWVNTFYPQEVEQIKMLLGTIFKNSKSIKNHGWVDKKTLAKYWKKSDIWFYPCKFKETFCLTALEAAITKTYVISNDLAALQDTVGDRGDVILGDATTPEWKQEAFKRICEYFDNPDSEKVKRLIQKNYEWALTHSWKDRANDLITNYLQVINTSLKYENNQNLTLNNIETSEDEKILKEMEQLNYMDMYNWLQDLPRDCNAKQIFKDILMTFKNQKCNILEVGTFAGMSVIGMLKYLPNAFAYTIDSWKNYSEKTRENTDIDILKNIEQLNVEQVFYQNVEKAGMKDRIKALKGDSSQILLNLIAESPVTHKDKNGVSHMIWGFDFIYVDASHLCLDCFVDCLLSWKLLKKGGIMGIDDYMYNVGYRNVLEIPFEGVNRFLEKIEGQYKVLNKGYRLFIQKL
jgi:predicted O-methyltransferase YrrM